MSVSVLYSADRLMSLDIRRRNNAEGARPCLCHAAPPTAVGGAHNSPVAISQCHHDIEEWLHFV